VKRALLDTSVLIDLPILVNAQPDRLPDSGYLSAVSMAELVQGPLMARSNEERARRQRRLQDVMTAFPMPLPFDAACVSAYGPVVASTITSGRSSRRLMADLMIAATALAHRMPLVTRNADDVRHLDDLIEIIVA
jgi:predicted nucleic acid-binding protein